MLDDDCLCLLHHLALCNPEGSLCDCHGKIIDLNAVKLRDGYLDRVKCLTKYHLPAGEIAYRLVLQTTKAEVRFR